MDIRFTGGLTLQEALEMIYADDDDDPITDIFITPPEPHELTDEDSGDETEVIPDHFTGRQLLAEAEIGRKVSHSDDSEPFDQGTTTPTLAEDEVVPELSYEIFNKQNIQWIQADLTENKRIFPPGDYKNYHMSAVDLFELFFDESVFSLLEKEIRRYAMALNFPDPKVSIADIKCFIAILVVSGYNELPGKKFYWVSEDDMKNDAIANAMRRDRFFQIMRFLHCQDNTKMDPNDKLWKLRPLISKIQTNFTKYFVPEQDLAYDESMVKYYGHHGCKQFIRGKPIRFGYKVWSLNTKEGYLVNFEVYQGKRFRGNEKIESCFGKAAAPLVAMVQALPNKQLPYRFYVDNLFSGIPLFNFLQQNGYSATGTFRDNRISKNCPMKSKLQLKKAARGTYDSCLARDVGILFVRWVDNSIVTAASTSFGIQPISNVKRYSQADKKVIQVPRPHLIGQYNYFMGGTDQMDQNISRYRISIRGKKWWWCIFTWLVDAAINNAWVLRKKAAGLDTDQLSFRRELTQIYLRKFGVKPKPGGRPATSKDSVSCNRVDDNFRYDRQDHLLTNTPNKKRRRCAGEGCTSVVRTMCKKCNVGMCIECNIIFHTPTI